MRIWSLHPGYLDTKGLVALWRETLLARHVLEGKTKGYRHHPQLQRFRETSNPIDAIHQYLAAVYDEARKRNYNFDQSKIKRDLVAIKMTVTTGQLHFETLHLMNKLRERDPNRYAELKKLQPLDPHPLFEIVEGEIEPWETV